MPHKEGQGVSWFWVCRSCRTIFDQPSGSPFCDGTCAIDWGRYMLQQHRGLRLRFLCSEPPRTYVGGMGPTEWMERETRALKAEVW